MFVHDDAFEAGSERLASLRLCDVRLQRDARFARLVLIPRVDGAREIEDLVAADRATLMEEVVLCGQAVRAIGEALGRPVFKLNVAALGNITAQLHVHVVGRRPDDPAWPGPVWGFSAPEDHEPDALAGARAARAVLCG